MVSRVWAAWGLACVALFSARSGLAITCLQNGDFELFGSTGGWTKATLGATQSLVNDGTYLAPGFVGPNRLEPPINGSYDLVFVDPGVGSVSYHQDVDLGACPGGCSLTWSHQHYTDGNVNFWSPTSSLTVTIRDTGDTVLSTLFNSDTNGAGVNEVNAFNQPVGVKYPPVKNSHDMSGFASSTIRVHFNYENQNSGKWFHLWLDDIVVHQNDCICAVDTGVCTAPPTTTGTTTGSPAPGSTTGATTTGAPATTTGSATTGVPATTTGSATTGVTPAGATTGGTAITTTGSTPTATTTATATTGRAAGPPSQEKSSGAAESDPLGGSLLFIIIGVAVGVCLVVVLVAVAVVLVRRRRRDDASLPGDPVELDSVNISGIQSRQSEYSAISVRGGDSDGGSPDSGYSNLPESAFAGMSPSGLPSSYGGGSEAVKAFAEREKDWDMDFGELKLDKEVGSGAFGSVWKAKWRATAVAVKMLHFEGRSEDDLDAMLNEFEAEAALMKALRPHSNLVQFQGVAGDDRRLAIVSEFCPNGSVLDWIQDADKELPRSLALQWMSGIASGMLHLHLENVVHRDLAARK
jgi:Protein tyrosine and serine/threonine kinase